MTEIKRFFIVCKKCYALTGKAQCLCNVEWRPEGAFIFTCMECDNKELVIITVSKTPTSKEEFEEELKKDRLKVKVPSVS